MDNNYLQNLIAEAKNRGGGLILDVDGKPEVVVLTISKYNDLISKSEIRNPKGEQENSPLIQAQEPKLVQKVLVTGGAGYIGSHAVWELIENGHEVVIIDNLSCGKRENLHPKAKFYEGDLGDLNFLRDVFANEKIDAVMHFAASIEVEESVKEPAKYFQNNVICTYNLLEAMKEAGCGQIIFSSTAAVYGQPDKLPISENSPVRPKNPYGFSKLLAEKTIKYYCQFAGFKAVVFRYFNACGCMESGRIVATHHSHLIDNVMEVAVGNKPQVTVYGEDFPTFDGSGVRDYVHVKDIARAHVIALGQLSVGNYQLPAAQAQDNFQVYNIGTGKGKSVLEIINTAAEILNKIIPMEISARRAGDPAELVADCSKIKASWGFEPEFSSIETIIKTAHKQKVENTERDV